ncbi:MAG: 4Fe-4S binding protein [Candidatus Gastranaerophilales bacterium]|nr:4Fe-4S binding protein [Candidatus Gastranaerophilales bacterium]
MKYKIRLTIAGIVLLASICAVLGFYPVHFLNIEFSPILQKTITNYTVFSLIILVLLVLFTIFFGRFYCSILCPFGILQEFVNLIFNKIKGKKLPALEYIEPKPVKYFILSLCFGALIGGSAVIIRHIDPYTLFGSFISLSKLGIILTLIVLTLVFFKNRFFCTSICPVGAILGLLAKFAPFKVYMNDNCVQCGMCARYCPSKCINHKEKNIKSENCVKCLKCTSVCPKGAMKYGLKPKFEPFDVTRRKALISTGAIALFIGAWGMGVKISKDLFKNIKNVILPAGAQNAQKMANKCLNCNLCVNNCPQGILQKANSEIPAVHIDYSKGNHYCKYDCKKCSEICPAGAIKRLTLEEKQNTKIAMASVNNYCIGCGACIRKCPKKAISITDGLAKVDGALCIGCGACKAVCPMAAIDIFAINKQM